MIEAKTESTAVFTNAYDPDKTTATFIGFKYLDGKPVKYNDFRFALYEADADGNQTSEHPIEIVSSEDGGFSCRLLSC